MRRMKIYALILLMITGCILPEQSMQRSTLIIREHVRTRGFHILGGGYVLERRFDTIRTIDTIRYK